MKIPVFSTSITSLEKEYVKDALDSSWIGGSGKYLDRFENIWAEICNSKEAIAVSNGTVAIELALMAHGISKGDEVIVPSLTYVSTAASVKRVGATPVFVDVDNETWCIDVDKIENVISEKTKCILPVHLFGHPADMDAIHHIARKNNLDVIVDAAQSHFAEYKGKITGSLAETETFSFHSGKILACGEGGIITCNDKKKAEWMRYIRNHAIDIKRRFYFSDVGVAFRLTNIAAAIACAQIERSESIINHRISFFKRYADKLKNVSGISFRPVKNWAKLSPWVFSIIVNEDNFGMDRNQLTKLLLQNGIETRPFYVPLPSLPPYKPKDKNDGQIEQEFKVAFSLSRDGMYLPSSTELTYEQVDYICEVIHNIHNKKLF